MSDSIKLKISVNGIGEYFQQMAQRASVVDGWLNRVAYPEILKAQKQRWMTKGASEGNTWDEITPSYAKRKLRRFADYPGSGRRLLIATGRLAYSMTLDNSLRGPKSTESDHGKIVGNNRLEIESFVPYGKYVNEDREFTTLGKETTKRLADMLHDYVVGK